MTEIEQDHIVDAYTFELGKVEVPAVVDRMMLAPGTGRHRARPPGRRRSGPRPRRRPARRRNPARDARRIGGSWLTVAGDDHRGRVSRSTDGSCTILANDGCDLAGIRRLQQSLLAGRRAVPRRRDPQGRHRRAAAGRRTHGRPLVPHVQLGRVPTRWWSPTAPASPASRPSPPTSRQRSVT